MFRWSNNIDAAIPFYKELFSWDMTLKTSGHTDFYEITSETHEKIGYVMKMGASIAPSPSNWMVYMNTEECEQRANQVKQMGGVIHKDKTEIPGLGYFSIVADPLGATFGLFEKVKSEKI